MIPNRFGNGNMGSSLSGGGLGIMPQSQTTLSSIPSSSTMMLSLNASGSNGGMNSSNCLGGNPGCTSPLDLTFSAGSQEDRSRTNLIINYLPQSFDQNDLFQLFETIGPIRQCKLIRDKVTGASLCYGFVDFINPQHAGQAIQNFHTYEIDQKRLRVAYASAGAKHRLGGASNSCSSTFGGMGGGRLGSMAGSSMGMGHQSQTGDSLVGWEVCVMGVPNCWTQSDISEIFGTFGRLVQIRLFPALSGFGNDGSSGGHGSGSPSGSPLGTGLDGISPTGSSGASSGLSGTATLIYEDRSSADQAVYRMNGTHRPDWSQPLMVKVIGPVTRNASTFGPTGSSSTSVRTSGLGLSGDLGMLDSDFGMGNSGAGLGRRVQRGITGGTGNGDILSSAGLTGDGIGSADDISTLLSSFPDHFSNMLSMGSGSGTNGTSGLNGMGTTSNSSGMRINQGRPIVKNKMNGSSSSNSAMLGMGGTGDNGSFGNSNVLGMGHMGGHQSSLSPLDDLQSDFTGMLPNIKNSLGGSNAGMTTSSGNHHPSGGSGSSVTHSAWPGILDHSGPSSGVGSGIHAATGVGSGVSNIYVRTPLVHSTGMSALSNLRVMLKLENTQPSGSFKLRGVANFCKKAALSGATRIVCSSGGNAGLAAANACSKLSLPLTVVVPETTPEMMRQRIEWEGANVQVCGQHWADAHNRAIELSSMSSMETTRLLHPYDHPDLWEGYETIVDELAADMVHPPDVIVTAVGGGGLLNGIIQGLWRNGWTNTTVVAMETLGADCLNRSVAAKRRIHMSEITSICKSLGAASISERTWDLIQRIPVCPVTCTDQEAVSAVGRFLDEHGMLVEPSCGAALAAIYSGVLARLQAEGKLNRVSSVVVIVCGGRSIDREMLADYERDLAGQNFIKEEIHDFIKDDIVKSSASLPGSEGHFGDQSGASDSSECGTRTAMSQDWPTMAPGLDTEVDNTCRSSQDSSKEQ